MSEWLQNLKWKPKVYWREPDGELYINPVIAIGSIMFVCGIVIGLLV